MISPDFRIAMLSSIAAVLGGAGGIFAWVQAVRVTRIRAEAERALEAMKLETERRRRAFELASAEIEPLQTALTQAWSDVQVLKDAIAKTLSPSRYDTRSALELVDPATTRLTEGYARWGGLLQPEAKSEWHRAKDLAATVGVTLRTGEESASEERTERLKEVRLALTDVQLTLSAVRATVREAHVRRILEQL